MCLRCQKAGKECINEGPTNRIRVFRGFKPANVQVRPREQVHFDHFCKYSLPILSGFEPSPLWKAVKDAISRRGSPVRDIAAAVGAQHMGFIGSASPQDAQEAYIQAVHALRTSMSSATAETISEVLMASLLLAVLQCLRGTLVEAMVHLHGGVQIAKNLLGTMQNVELKECLRLLEQLALKITISESRSEAGIQAMGLVYDLWNATQSDLENDIQLSEASVMIAEQQIIRGLLAMIHHCFKDQLDGDQVQQQLAKEQADVIDKLKHKRASLEGYLKQRLDSLRSEDDLATLARSRFMLARCLLLKVFLNCAWDGTQIIYDMEYSTYEQIVDLLDTALTQLNSQTMFSDGTQLAFSFGLGALSVIALVAAKCRNPHLRRRALALLDKCPPREGVWTTDSARQVIQAIIAYEESSASAAGHIPEEARIHHYIMKEEQDGEHSPGLIIFRVTTVDAVHFTRETIAL